MTQGPHYKNTLLSLTGPTTRLMKINQRYRNINCNETCRTLSNDTKKQKTTNKQK